MTRTKRRVVWSIVAGLMLTAWILPSGAEAQGPFGGMGARGRWGGGLMLGIPLSSMNLTPDQTTQVRSILSTYRTSARPIIQQLQQAQSILADRILTAGPLQAADLGPQLQQITQLRTQLLGLSAQAMVDVRNLLTPDQITVGGQVKDKLRQLRSEMRQLLEPGTP